MGTTTFQFDVRDVQRFARLGEIPNYVKEAEMLTRGEVKALPATAFGDDERQLPVHTKAATWLSALKHLQDADHNNAPAALPALEKAAQVWGISDDLRTLEKTIKTAAYVPALDGSRYAMLVKDKDQIIEQRWPLQDGSTVKAASAGLYANRARYPYALRKEAAKKILQYANEFQVTLPEQTYLEQASGYGIAKAAKLKKVLVGRRHLSKSAATRDSYQKRERQLLDLFNDNDLVSGEVLDKIASFIDEQDRHDRLFNAYDRGLPTPEEAVFSEPLERLEKAASGLRCIDGSSLDLDKLAGVPADRFAALGDDFVDAIAGDGGSLDLEKVAAIVPTLPADDLSVFRRSLTL